MKLRLACRKDLPLLVKLRLDYLNDGEKLKADLSAVITEKLKDYFEKHIDDGSFYAWILEENNEVAATGFLVAEERPANPSWTTGKIGTMLNIYTYPKFRRRGFGEAIVKGIIEKSKELELSVIELSATKEGKRLYDKLGFYVSGFSAMRLKLINR